MRSIRISFIRRLIFIAILLSFSTFMGCKLRTTSMTIISGSENEELEPIINEFGKNNGIQINMKYKGSIDIMLGLESETINADAVWPANSLWISLGDKNRQVKHLKSIMTSPVVLGVKKSKAKELGFIDKDIKVQDILNNTRNGKLSFIMTSATQSNSGASAYFGFLYALLGNPDILTKEQLYQPELKKSIRDLLAGVNRSSGSSGWLKDLFLNGNYDAMFNYESVIIETNKILVEQDKEPLYIVYPIDGIVLSDSPLGLVNRTDPKIEEAFLKLQNHLLSDKIQKEIQKLGRRTGFGGMVSGVDLKVFNPDWGFDPERILTPIKIPSAEVINEALNLYQTEFRKPSYTIYCIDYSGSMAGNGEKQMKKAMSFLLDQKEATKYMINASSEDRLVIIPFSNKIHDKWEVTGNKQVVLDELSNKIKKFQPAGGTDIYSPIIEAINGITDEDMKKYIVSVVLMTDGESNTGAVYKNLFETWNKASKDIPVFGILFGEASKNQMQEITDMTNGRIFDGRNDLIDAFRKAKGYN